MTYHILIVDDEPIVRNGLQSFEWGNYGFECVGSCENGREALEWLNHNAVEVVLTDIKMPGIDGVELSRQIQERYPDIFVILLTGYNEFTYAQQAIKSGVFDYLLKPAEDSDFEKVLAKCTQKLRERDKSNKILSVLSHHFLLRNQLNESHLSADVREMVGKQLSIRQDQPFKLILIYLEEESSEMSKEFDHWHFVRISKREWVSLVSNEVIDSLLCSLIEHEIRFNVGISSLKTSKEDVPEAFSEANKALKKKFLLPDEQIFQYMDHFDEVNDWKNVSDIIKKIILVANRINGLNPSKIEEQLSDIVREIETKEISEKHIKQLLTYLISALETELVKLSFFNMKRWHTEKTNFMHLIHTADRFETIKISLVSEISRFIQEVNSDNTRIKESTKLGEVLEYIHLNYPLVLSLDLISEQFDMHPNFFSKWFKENKGINFIDYASRYRIDKSKELLEQTNMKTSQIAESVGIADARYFGQVFKKLVGLTPSEYRALFK
jgi:two-component system response regulator YesN